MTNDMKEFLRAAAHVKPSPRQLKMFKEIEFYAFIHFGPNTFTQQEWGKGNENPAVFNPTDLNCDEWVEAIKSAGMKGVVITAKHHDGFCLWQTRCTGHSMKNSPYKNGEGDIVRELSDACLKGGLKFGFYLSPWDMNSKLYGTPEYNDYYKAQLTELLTGYGEIFHVWFDGACGEGPNGKKQEYDFDGYIELIRRYQPNATIFSDFGPDIRWVGNESGAPRAAEWAVVPSEFCSRNNDIQTSDAMLDGDLSHMYNTDPDIGSLSNIIYSKGLVFCPSEVDMSIRKGWFYRADEEPHSLDRLFETYINSVGANSTFILNIPPMPSGRFDPRDIERLAELGAKIKEEFSDPFERAISINECEGETMSEYVLTMDKKRLVKYVVMREDIAQGQRIESFKLYAKNSDGLYDNVFVGSCVGNRKICKINVITTEIKILITAARDKAVMTHLNLY